MNNQFRDSLIINVKLVNILLNILVISIKTCILVNKEIYTGTKGSKFNSTKVPTSDIKFLLSKVIDLQSKTIKSY